MRSIFDQYDSPENRLTHALGCCLERDRGLLRAFVRWVTDGRKAPAGKLEVLEQQVPGMSVAPVEEDESTGLPDLWVHDNGQWSLIVESKVQAKVSAGQLHRHRRTAERNGFTDLVVLVLAPTIPARRVPGVTYRAWPQVYTWMRRQARRYEWAECMANYMEIAEARMTADGYLDNQPLTEFDGIPFGPDHPYTYREAKRVLRLALDELRTRRDLQKLGMDPEGPGRPAITGKDGTAVWDFLPLRQSRGRSNFTACPHLTICIQAQKTILIVTLPNAVPAAMRHRLTRPGLDAFKALLSSVSAGVARAVRPITGASPYVEAVQRHYLSQRSAPIEDARLDFDLRTAGEGFDPKVKQQDQWLEAIFHVLENKHSNFQVGIGAKLPYGDPCIRSKEVLNVIARVWIACKPWIETVLRPKS